MKARFSAYIRECKTGPLVITRNGRPVGVLLAVEDEDEIERLILGYTPRLRAILEAADQRIGAGQKISHEELRALYSTAMALLFPSYQEGFGWPVVEAQACGCPVITSARSPMKEVSGGAAILIDPEDAAGAAATILARIRETAWLREAGLANIKNYSMDTTKERYLDVYREIVHASK